MIIDMFAGPGGWDEALAMHGRRDVLGVELDPAANATARAAGHRRVQGDISAARMPVLARLVVEGIVASPPCQGFSAAGKGRGRDDIPLVFEAARRLGAGEDPEAVLAALDARCSDHRTSLVLEPLRWVLGLRPAWTVWEQVPTVLPLWDVCGEVLSRAGWNVWTGKLHAEQYAVAQTRTRAFLIASRDVAIKDRIGPPVPTHSRFHIQDPTRLDVGVAPWVSMAQTLGQRSDGRLLRSNYGTGGDPRNRGERTEDQPAPTVTSKIGRNKWVWRNGNQAHSARRALDEPAPTIHFSARSNKVEWMQEDLAPDPAASGIRVTVEEAGALQSFRDAYPWRGTVSQRFEQVGNAVPPLLGRAALGVVLA